jgi:thiol-disulfide isomerase/thioredoxin
MKIATGFEMRVVYRMFVGLIFASTLSSLSASTASAITPLAPQSRGAYTSYIDDQQFAAGGAIQSPDQMLTQANKLADEGKLKSAITVSSRAYQNAQHNPRFAINYIDALTSMAKRDGKKWDNKLLNNAIKAANTLHKSKLCTGQGDAELAYHFMTSLGILGDEILDRNKRIAGQLYRAEGKIAQNLRNNPGYPSQSLAVLGDSLMDLARAHAINDDEVSAIETINEAFTIGYTDFDGVEIDRAFADVDQRQIKKTVRFHKIAYKKKLARWSREELARFGRFQLNFDVADVDGGRISSEELKGKVTVVDLWATWCAPCRKGIPHFVKLDHEYGSKKVSVLGISMDEPNDPASAVDAVKNFAIDNDIDYQLAVGTDAIKSQIPGRVLLPTTLFVEMSDTSHLATTISCNLRR